MIVRRLSFGLFAVLVSICLLAFTAFASPSLSDADISFSVHGYFTQYMTRTTYEQGKQIGANGTIITAQSNSYKLSDYVAVIGGGSIFVYYTSGNVPSQIRSICFYDSAYQVISGGYDEPNSNSYPQFVNVPSGAAYCRYNIFSASTVSGVNATRQPVAAPEPDLNINNYTDIWTPLSSISIDSDGNVVIPYQTTQYNMVMLDFRFFDSTYQFRTLSFSCYSTYTSGQFTGERLLPYGSGGVEVDSYYIDNETGDIYTDDSIAYTSTDNPFRCLAQIPYDRFSGFRLYISLGGDQVPTPQISSSIHVRLYDFELDGIDVSLELSTQSALNGLDDLGDALVLPSPNTQLIYNDVSIAVGYLQDDNFTRFAWFGPSGGIFITMCVISVTFAALGYILFGKRG